MKRKTGSRQAVCLFLLALGVSITGCATRSSHSHCCAPAGFDPQCIQASSSLFVTGRNHQCVCRHNHSDSGCVATGRKEVPAGQPLGPRQPVGQVNPLAEELRESMEQDSVSPSADEYIAPADLPTVPPVNPRPGDGHSSRIKRYKPPVQTETQAQERSVWRPQFEREIPVVPAKPVSTEPDSPKISLPIQALPQNPLIREPGKERVAERPANEARLLKAVEDAFQQAIEEPESEGASVTPKEEADFNPGSGLKTSISRQVPEVFVKDSRSVMTSHVPDPEPRMIVLKARPVAGWVQPSEEQTGITSLESGITSLESGRSEVKITDLPVSNPCHEVLTTETILDRLDVLHQKIEAVQRQLASDPLVPVETDSILGGSPVRQYFSTDKLLRLKAITRPDPELQPIWKLRALEEEIEPEPTPDTGRARGVGVEGYLTRLRAGRFR